LNEEARKQRKHLKIHIKVDTGMGRIGASCQSAVEIAKELLEYPYLEFAGLSTHLANVTPEGMEFTSTQIKKFSDVIRELDNLGIRPPLIHIANSAATFMLPQSHFNMVRVGISAYGILPSGVTNKGEPLLPILTLKTKIAFIKSVPAGTYIGYSQKYKTTRPAKIATAPVGYNDGYPYLLGNKSFVLIHGRLAPVVGTITMDYIMIDCTDIPQVKTGDKVILIGKSQDKEIRVDDLAKIIGTIPYEITCGLGKRVKRIYTEM